MSRYERLFGNLKVIELSGNECSLCDATFDTTLVATKCGHLFCVTCLEESMCEQKSRKPPVKLVCPICDASIEKSGQSRQRLKLKIKRLAKVSQMEKEKFLKLVKMYRSLKCEDKRSKIIRISISSDSDAPQDDQSSPWSVNKFACKGSNLCLWTIIRLWTIFSDSINLPNKVKVFAEFLIQTQIRTQYLSEQQNKWHWPSPWKGWKWRKSTVSAVAFASRIHWTNCLRPNAVISIASHASRHGTLRWRWIVCFWRNARCVRRTYGNRTNVNSNCGWRWSGYKRRRESYEADAIALGPSIANWRIINTVDGPGARGHGSGNIIWNSRIHHQKSAVHKIDNSKTKSWIHFVFYLFTKTTLHFIALTAQCLLLRQQISLWLEFAIDDWLAFVGLCFGQLPISFFGKIDFFDGRHYLLGVFSLQLNAPHLANLEIEMTKSGK